MHLRPELIRCFEQAAWVIGGHLEVHPGYGDTRELPLLRVSIEGAPVEASIERGGLGQFFRTVVRAPARGALGLSMSIYTGRGSKGQTGDPEFDGEFVVRANDDDYARLWLDEHVRRRIRSVHFFRSPVPFDFELNEERAFARRKHFEHDPEPLIRAINAVGAMAARGRRLLDRWRTLADELGGEVVADGSWRPDTRARIDCRLAGARVVIDNIHGAVAGSEGRRNLLTRVSCPRHGAEPELFVLASRAADNPVRPTLQRAQVPLSPGDLPLATDYAIRCQSRERAVALLGGPASEQIERVRPAAILANPEQVTVLLRGFEDDSQRLSAAGALARQLAVQVDPAGLAGPYR